MKTKIAIFLTLTATSSWAAPVIFWSGYQVGQSDGIYRADADGNNVQQIIPPDALEPPDFSHYVGLPMDLAVDASNEEIYTISTEDDTIWKMDFAGTTFQAVHVVDGTDPHQLEADFANQHIYWLEDNAPGSPARIGRCDLDGSNPTYLVTDAGSRAGGLALDAKNGFIFWTESYYFMEPTNIAVWRCDLSGNHAQAIITNFAESTFELGTIAVDPEAQRVYWLQDHSLIRRADYDGANAKTLYEESALDDRSGLVVDTHRDELFWTSLSDKTVGRAALDGSFNGPLIANLPSSPLGITVMPDGFSGAGAPEITLGQFNPSDSSLTVYWPQRSAGWQLEFSTSLASGSWTQVPTNYITLNGINGTAVLNADEPSLFLRLHQTGP